jgi:hypothetical protein
MRCYTVLNLSPARRAIVVAFIVVLLIAVFLYYRSKPGGARTVSHGPVSTPSVTARAGPEYAYPNLDLTPGAIDPTVTQDNIQSTICVPGYTRTVRPPERIARRLKLQIMEAYRRSGDLKDYELDHFIPLELGGCPDCVTNLWPESYDPSFGAKQKDRVENHLHRQVCSGDISLKEGQDEIRNDWVQVYDQISSVR